MTITPAVMPGAKPIPPHTPLAPLPDVEAALAAAEARIDQNGADRPAQPPERPTPALMPHSNRGGPLYGIQFLRREALRLAIEFYRDNEADDVTDGDVLASAERFAEFIRCGNITEP